MRILIVEDEVLVGLDLVMQLEDEGHRCIGPCQSVEKALEVVETTEFDCAILDVNLGKSTSLDIAKKLISLDKPFVYVSGYGEFGVMEQMPKAPTLQKPLRHKALLNAIRDHLSQA